MLDDLLRPGLRLVICGTAVGGPSGRRGTYYAGPGNRFWCVLSEVALTPGAALQTGDFRKLLDFGIGLTDLAKGVSGNDAGIDRSHFDIGAFRTKMLELRPLALGFNGKKAASVFLAASTDNISYGIQPAPLGTTTVWVLPSTSGSARAYWSIEPWRDLARSLSAVV